MSTTISRRRPRHALIGLLMGAAVLVAVVFSARALDTAAAGVAVPVPVYEIESEYNGHKASLANLQLGQPGAPQAPVPVDVDGDLLPDVNVSVNLINANGLFNNPPEVGEIIAPNVKIERFLQPGLPLGRKLAQLRINVKLTVKDSEGAQPDTVIRFGYDTGEGGSIPGTFDAVVGGLEDFFNPIEAIVETKGGLRGVEAVPLYHEGPLTVVAGVEQGDFRADADLAYDAWPDAVRFTYLSDEAGGQHMTYAHGLTEEVHLKYGTDVNGKNVKYVPGELPEVDLLTTLRVRDGGDTLDLEAAVDRMPRSFGLDLFSDDGRGRIDYRARSDGRAPDVAVDLRSTSGTEVTNAAIDVEALPPELHALYDLPTDGGPVSARFTTVDPDDPSADPKDSPGLGAIEATVTNFDGDPAELQPFVPGERQFLNFQSRRTSGGDEERIISGRIERVRDITFGEADDGFDVAADVGDGVSPLELHVDTDALPDGDLLEAAAVMQPLPDRIAVSLRNGSTDDLDDPFTMVYDSAATADITGRVEVRDQAAADASCGLPGTLCGDVLVRNLPTHLETRIGQRGEGPGAEARYEVDAERRPGAPKPDVLIDALVGLDDGLSDPTLDPGDPVVTHLDAALLGIPDHVRVRTVEGPGEALEAVDVLTCVVDDVELGTCAAGTEGELARADVNFANFLPDRRPADFPEPRATAPNFANVVGRGLPDSIETVRTEVSARLRQIRQLRLLDTAGLFGVRSHAGGGQDLQTVLDIRDVDDPGDSPDAGRVDTVGEATLSPLPEEVDFCMRENGQTLTLASPAPFTDACENEDPFGDGSLTSSPLTAAYRASSGLSVLGEFEISREKVAADPADDHALRLAFDVDDLPKDLTAHVVTPPADTVGPARVLMLAPGATDLDVAVAAEERFGGADCDDPDPAVDVTCIDMVATDLPESLSAYVDPTSQAARAELHACDWDFVAATPGCRDTEGEIGSVEVGLRTQSGSPRALPAPPVPTEDLYAVVLADQPSEDDAAMQVLGRLEGIRHVEFVQSADGFDAHTDLGDGTKNLEAHIRLETRPDTDGTLMLTEALVEPLPEQITISQRGPGADPAEEPLVFTYDTSSVVDVTAHAEIYEIGAGSRCADRGTICADVEVIDLPSHLQARFADSAGTVGAGNQRDSRLDLAIDVEREIGQGQPDVNADLAMGPSLEDPPEEQVPLFLETSLEDLPDHVRVRMDSIETVDGDGVTIDQEIERLQFHACDRDFDAEACTAAPGEIGSVRAKVRNFRLRPNGFPPPPSFTEPLHASVTSRGDGSLEADVVMTDITELQFVNFVHSVGVRSVAGGNQPFAVRADFGDLSLGDTISLGERTLLDPVADIVADARVANLPGELEACFRQGAIAPVPSPSGVPFTAVCEQLAPFGPAVDLDQTPLSVAYEAELPDGDTFDIEVEGKVEINGARPGGGVHPTHRINGRVKAVDLPKELEAHILTPEEQVVTTPDGPEAVPTGPMRVKIVSPDAPGPTIDFDAEYLVGDGVICEDPRTDVEAFCVGGRITNLPTGFDLFFDPTLTDDNLVVTSSGSPGVTNFENLRLSSVKPRRHETTNAIVPGQADVLVVTGFEEADGGASLLGLPKPLRIEGDIDLPDSDDDPPSVQFEVVDRPETPGVDTLGQFRATVRNFIAPDPTAGIVAPPRPVGGTPDQSIEYVQRGEAFRVRAQIQSVRGASYRAVPNTEDGSAIGTHEAGLDFGGDDQNVRAFVDLQSDASQKVLADVLLEDVPVGIDLCFRGPRTAGQKAKTAVDPTFCDDPANVADDEGGFEFFGRSASLASAGMDVDAFVRIASGGGGDLLAARADIEDIPFVLRGTFPSGSNGDVDIAGFRDEPAGGPVNLVPDGIGSIDVNAASFDLDQADTGYSGALPYSERKTTVDIGSERVLPVPAPPSGQYAHVGAGRGHFQARARIGLAAGPDSELQRLRIGDDACAAPPNNPPDYPHYPDDEDTGVSDYTCVLGAFQSSVADPLALDVRMLTGDGDLVKITEAGITDVPNWFQATLTDTAPYQEGEGQRWRRPCGPAASEPAGAVDCMAPLLRVDQPLATSRVFGVLDFGKPLDLALLGAPGSSGQGIQPGRPLAELNALPASQWGDWGSDPTGARATVLQFGSATELHDGDDRTAVRAAFRLPVPQSLTIDQIQKFDDDQLVKATTANPALGIAPGDPVSGQKAKDIRLRVAIHDAAGQPVDNDPNLDLGEATALIHDVDNNGQILLSAPCAQRIAGADATGRPSDCPEYDRGLELPSELGLQLYTREDVAQVSYNDEDFRRNTKFFHIDGRVSAPLSAGVRILSQPDPGEEVNLGSIELAVRGTPSGVSEGDPANPVNPSFRYRFSVIDDTSLETDPVLSFIGEKQISVNTVFADVDLSPNDANPARRIDGVVHMRGAAVGVDIGGFSTLGGTGVAPISAAASVDVDPLNIDMRWVLDLPIDDLADIVREALSELGFVGDIIGEILGFVIDAVDFVLEAILNALPLRIELAAGVLAQLDLDRIERLTLNTNIIQVEAKRVDTASGGSMTLGPVNFEARKFYGGFNFELDIPVPFPIDLIPGVPDPIEIRVPLLGIEYIPVPVPFYGNNSLLEFRDCDASLALPLPLPSFDNEVEIEEGDDFVINPLADQRYIAFGVIPAVITGVTGGAGFFVTDYALDFIVKPILCLALDADDFYQGMGDDISSGSVMYPGAASSVAYQDNHPIPGQPGQPVIGQPAPTEPYAPPAPPAPVPDVTEPPPPAPPGPEGPTYTGPDEDISGTVDMCGTHTFDQLTVSGTIRVATAANGANTFGTGALCPAGSEGRLKLRANSITVSGTVDANGIVTTNPPLPTGAPAGSVAYADGIAGGGHGGAGGNGSMGTGGTAYGTPLRGAATETGAPGAGPAPGAGGGAIMLEGETVTVSGVLTADGTDGADDTAGACDADPDDGDPGDQADVDDTADPPYEHTGGVGSGGGSGGGIAIAGEVVDLTGAQVHANGGDGGLGRLGAGGGGGGGIVSVTSPIPTGITGDVEKGANGNDATLPSPCADIAPATEAGDGVEALHDEPTSKVAPFPVFWHAGAPPETVDTYVSSAALSGAANGVTVQLCAVKIPVDGTPANEPTLLTSTIPNPSPPPPTLLRFRLPQQQPTLAHPCGQGGGTAPVSPVVLSRTRVFEDQLEVTDPDAKLGFVPPAALNDTFAGIYSVAFRPRTAGNDCFNPSDQPVNDAIDCVVERVGPIADRVIGVDGTQPTATINSPVAPSETTTTRPFVTLDLSGTDPASGGGPGSGFAGYQCRTTPQTTFSPCAPGTFELLGGDGDNVIEVRSIDIAGNLSPIDTVTVRLDQNAPTATATVSAPNGDNGWHKTAPAITISGYDEGGGLAPSWEPTGPYVWKIDGGAEQTCPAVAPAPKPPATATAPVCNVPSSAFTNLFPGGHTFHFTAVDSAGNRLFDAHDLVTPGPMQRPSPTEPFDFKFDGQAPQVTVAVVPPQPDQAFGGGYHSNQPFVLFAATDQVGGSGPFRIEYDLDDGVGFRTHEGGTPNDPVQFLRTAAHRLGDGVHTICARAKDYAGNQSATTCQTIRVDSTAPAAAMTVDGLPAPAPTGNHPWFTSTPAVAFGGYEDGIGVGTDSDHFRYRVDNGGYVECNPGCSVPGALLPTGTHLVHFTAADRFDNRSTEKTVQLKVDLDAPTTRVLVRPPEPTGSNDWHDDEPYVVLDAVDQLDGSGVATTRYRLDGGASTPYAAPFEVADGAHDLCVWSTDVAGNAEKEHCVVIQVDTDDPEATVVLPPAPASDWYTSKPAFTLTGTDEVPGSGVVPGFDSTSDLCGHLPPEPDPLTPSGLCLSVDGSDFVAHAPGAPIVLGEGVHRIRSYAVDVSGRRSAMVSETARVDLSPPVASVRTRPPAPAANGWYRRVPDVVLRAVDGDQNSGVSLLEHAFGPAPLTGYEGPFAVPTGLHTLHVKATDRAGRTSTVGGGTPFKVDPTPPNVKALDPSPKIWVRGGFLQPKAASLNYQLNENLSPSVRVFVTVFDHLGAAVRRIDGGMVKVTPGTTSQHRVLWDGTDQSMLNMVPFGVYHYRVVAIDEAGNAAMSGESTPLQIKAP